VTVVAVSELYKADALFQFLKVVWIYFEYIREFEMKVFQVYLIAVLLLPLQAVYAGELDNNCTNGLANGMLIKTKCEINTVFEGKTYCFSSAESKQKFSENPKEMVMKATEFYAKNAETVREKISQPDAVAQIKSKTCDLSNKDAGYLELDGMDLRHCNMVNTSFFWRLFTRGESEWCQFGARLP
jgi:YHS domain-containing protein